MESFLEILGPIIQLLIDKGNPILIVVVMAFFLVGYSLYVLLAAIKTMNSKDSKNG